MKIIFRKIIFSAFILVGSSCSSSKSISSSEPKVNWLSFSQVQDSLRHSPKKVLVDVYTNWCQPCKKMDKVTYSNPEVVRYINKHFYAVKFNAETIDSIAFKSQIFTNTSSKNKIHSLSYELASIGGRIAFPTTIILDSRLEKKQVIASMLYPEAMLALLYQVQGKKKADN